MTFHLTRSKNQVLTTVYTALHVQGPTPLWTHGSLQHQLQVFTQMSPCHWGLWTPPSSTRSHPCFVFLHGTYIVSRIWPLKMCTSKATESTNLLYSMAKENWVADRIKVADQLTLKQGEYLGSYGWVQCNRKSPESGRDNRKGGQSDAMGEALTHHCRLWTGIKRIRGQRMRQPQEKRMHWCMKWSSQERQHIYF